MKNAGGYDQYGDVFSEKWLSVVLVTAGHIIINLCPSGLMVSQFSQVY